MPGRRASQAGADARYPVVVHQQRGEALQRREALQLDDLVVAQVDAVKLVLSPEKRFVSRRERARGATAREAHAPA
jgi:hypothetical protein